MAKFGFTSCNTLKNNFDNLNVSLDYSLTAKTWTGLTSFNGSNIWTDKNYIYYSSTTNQYVLDISTSTWTAKTWTGLTGLISFNGSYIWTDGTNIYFSQFINSSTSYQYVLDVSNNIWTAKTWNGYNFIAGSDIWTDGTYIYYSSSSNQYVLDISTSTWTAKTWNGLTDFRGGNIWTDGNYIYYSNGSEQYVLDISTSTWTAKTWTGLSSFYGINIWTDGNYYYYNLGYVLDITTNTWDTKTWTGLNSISGQNVWSDGTNIYFSSGTNQYIFNSQAPILTSSFNTLSVIDHTEYITLTIGNSSINIAKQIAQSTNFELSNGDIYQLSNGDSFAVAEEYTITTSVTNGTYSGATSIIENGTASVTLSADSGYSLPSSITVVGASYTYDSSNGVISLSNATGNVTITCVCESAGNSIIVTFQNSIHESDWEYTYIYDDEYLSNKIGEITSANGTTTVTTSTGKLSIDTRGANANLADATITITGGITIIYQTSTSIVMDISSNGSITIDGVDYDY